MLFISHMTDFHFYSSRFLDFFVFPSASLQFHIFKNRIFLFMILKYNLNNQTLWIYVPFQQRIQINFSFLLPTFFFFPHALTVRMPASQPASMCVCVRESETQCIHFCVLSSTHNSAMTKINTSDEFIH